jgi:hypothetical protein
VSRILRELTLRHARAAVDAAEGSLRVRLTQDGARIDRGEGDPLFPARHRRVEIATIGPGIYLVTPTSAARVRLLAAAGALSNRVEVHAPLSDMGTHLGRLLIDPIRHATAHFGERGAEPGDRFHPDFVHAFFDDEAIVREAARAGLRFAGRRGAWVVLRAEPPLAEHPRPFAGELMRVLAVLREAEHARRTEPAAHAVARMRAHGARANKPKRGPIGRARLRRAIGWVDAAHLRGPNCLRRALAELALDSGAAGETLVFGLDVDRTGHVAFKDAEDRSFDVAFEIPAT